MIRILFSLSLFYSYFYLVCSFKVIESIRETVGSLTFNNDSREIMNSVKLPITDSNASDFIHLIAPSFEKKEISLAVSKSELKNSSSSITCFIGEEDDETPIFASKFCCLREFSDDDAPPNLIDRPDGLSGKCCQKCCIVFSSVI